MANACLFVTIGFIVVLIIISTSLYGSSVAVLPADNYGLDFDGVQHTLDTKTLYHGGRYSLGLAHRFITFPRIVKALPVSGIWARGDDGCPVSLDVVVNYRLKPDVNSLVNLYLSYGDSWEDDLSRFVANGVRDVASQYNFTDFYMSRDELQDSIRTTTYSILVAQNVVVESVLLTNVKLPDPIEAQIQLTQIAVQDVQQAEYEVALASVNASTTILETQQQAQIVNLNAQAAAYIRIAQASTTAATIKANIDSEISAYGTLSNALNFTTPQQIINFLHQRVISTTTSSRSYLNIPVPASLGL